MVHNIPKTKKIQSMYQWTLLIKIQDAFLFITYASTITKLIPNFFQLNAYANDHSLRKSFNLDITLRPTNNTHTDDETGTIAIIEDTMLKVKTWMDAVHPKLNESKQNLYTLEADNS